MSMEKHHIQHRQYFMAIRNLRRRTSLIRFAYATLVALCCMILVPLPALACGGLFSAQTPVDQANERMIFAVDPGQVTLYEQINYTRVGQRFCLGAARPIRADSWHRAHHPLQQFG